MNDDRDKVVTHTTIKLPPGHMLVTYPDGTKDIVKVVNPYRSCSIRDLVNPETAIERGEDHGN